MKWINTDNVEFTRGNHARLMVKFDNSNVWLEPDYYCTTNTFKSFVRKLGNIYNSKVAEIKLFDKVYTPIEVVEHNGEYKFRHELKVPDGERRQFKYYEESEIWKISNVEEN